jgi:hypothetical protein
MRTLCTAAGQIFIGEIADTLRENRQRLRRPTDAGAENARQA